MYRRPMNTAIVEAFARSIFAKAELLRRDDLTQRERSRIMEAVSGDVRKYTDLIEHDASDAALALASELGISLAEVGWHDQHKFDPGRERFILEHVIPVKTVRDRCLLLPANRPPLKVSLTCGLRGSCEKRTPCSTRLAIHRIDPTLVMRTAKRASLSRALPTTMTSDAAAPISCPVDPSGSSTLLLPSPSRDVPESPEQVSYKRAGGIRRPNSRNPPSEAYGPPVLDGRKVRPTWVVARQAALAEFLRR